MSMLNNIQKIFNWFSNIRIYIDYLQGHAVKCDTCHEIVYGWFGTSDGIQCMRCAEADGPTIFTQFVRQHTKELLEGK